MTTLGCVVGALPSGVVVTGVVFNTEPTPVIWVGLPSEDTFNAVVGLFAGSLLDTSVALSVVKLTGFLPSLSSPTLTDLNSTSSFVENVNLPLS